MAKRKTVKAVLTVAALVDRWRELAARLSVPDEYQDSDYPRATILLDCARELEQSLRAARTKGKPCKST